MCALFQVAAIGQPGNETGGIGIAATGRVHNLDIVNPHVDAFVPHGDHRAVTAHGQHRAFHATGLEELSPDLQVSLGEPPAD